MTLFYRANQWLLRQMFLPYWPAQLEDERHLPRGAAIFVSNHPTVLDGLLFGSVLPRPIRFLVSEIPLSLPLIGPWLKSLGFIAVGRRSRALEEAEAALRSGDWIGIYPEAHPSHSYQLQEFRTGFALLAQRSGAPIIPVSLCGTVELLGPQSRYLAGGPTQVRFHPPILANQRKIEDVVEEVRQQIQQALDEYQPPTSFKPGWHYRMCAAWWIPFSAIGLALHDLLRPGVKR